MSAAYERLASELRALAAQPTELPPAGTEFVAQRTAAAENRISCATTGVSARSCDCDGETSMAIESNLHNPTSLESRETHGLIVSDKVQGTAVYRSNGEKVGQIARVMIDKRSGKVGYAVMSFGGFLGMGEDYYPLPWSLLTYNPRLEGYEVNIPDEQLQGAPKYGTNGSWDWATRSRAVDDYYGVSPKLADLIRNGGSTERWCTF
jgi:PRC-barrel domain protein